MTGSIIILFPQISHLIIFSLEEIKDSAKGTINCSLWFNRCKAALLADLGPNPGIFNRSVIEKKFNRLANFLDIFLYPCFVGMQS